jgi:hypothetical protein
MPKVWNRSKPFPADSVYIGRGSDWGNPFRSGIDGTRSEVIEKYRVYLFTSGLIDRVHELRGCDLVCFCKPKACHGDVLIELANPALEGFFE